MLKVLSSTQVREGRKLEVGAGNRGLQQIRHNWIGSAVRAQGR